jgi:2,3-bisphosphoglycerate-dependent phosphoglycerate mutase
MGSEPVPTDPAPVEEVRQLRFARPPGATDVLLIRHGESIPVSPDEPFVLTDGHGDPELDPRGRYQADRIGERLSGPGGDPIDAIYVTTLRRTVETATPLARRLGLEPRVESRLREVYLGEWEGGAYRIRIRENHPLARRMMEEERWDVIPGAEPDEDFARRVREGIDTIASRHPDQTVAVFTHGGVIGRALAEATGSRPFAFLGADNGSISHLVVADGGWVVRGYNDTGHLVSAG